MRNSVFGSIVALLCLSIAMLAQTGQSASAQTEQRGARGQGSAQSSTKDLPFEPHDFSGVWRVRQRAGEALSTTAPPMTPWAQTRYDAAKPGIGPRTQPLGNDPIMICDPVGFPRILLFNAYPLEIIQLPDRIIQFFDFFYTHRTIWTDGRGLPKDPEPSWYGYSVGKWDGDTLVVESSGFNDRSWLDEDGHPHSSDMRIEERYKRVDHDTIELTMTLTDPKAYAKPWMSETKTLVSDPKEEIREDVCVTSDEEKYREEVREPAGSKKQ
jgi:hypothetical protein